MDAPRIAPLGDAAIVVTFGESLSDAANDRALALDASLRHDPLPTVVRDIVPAIASLAVHVDPAGAPLEDVMQALRDRVLRLFPRDGSVESVEGTAAPHAFATHEIRVRYGGEGGPDLEDVAAFAGVPPSEVIARHAAAVYRVYMLGFLPGFAYLGQVDATIAAPRRATPRQAVPAGSVGIAGRQTGVYPRVSPGGWQIIGRTDAPMFEAVGGKSLLAPGDRVRFVPERG